MTTNDDTTCKKCIEEGWQSGRGCGYTGDAGNGLFAVWKEKSGTYKYELTECPISILSRESYYYRLAIDWSLLGTSPFKHNDIDEEVWLKVSAIKSEIEWSSRQITNDNKS